MAEDKVKVVKLPYMGPPKDTAKEKAQKGYAGSMPISSGSRVTVPTPTYVLDRDYAKGGDVQSESSKLDQKNAEMDKAQEEGYKRYQADQAREAKANADSRKSMPFFNFGKPEKKAKGGVIKSSASARADGCAQRGKTKGRMV
jgi:hypothetical protein